MKIEGKMKNLISLFTFIVLLSSTFFAQSTTLQLPTNTNASDFTITQNDGTELLKMLGGGQFYVKGTFGSGNNTITGAGTRLVWYPKVASLRAGYVDGTQWDDANVGNYSVAMGYNATASGNKSFAVGENCTASGSMSFAAGESCVASGTNSFAFGEQSEASGGYSIALIKSVASGLATFSVGTSAQAAGDYSMAVGQLATTRGENAIAMGFGTLAIGKSSFCTGRNTTAQALNSFVIGKKNVVEGDSLNWVDTDPLFVCGNGTSTTTSNALTLYKNGNMTIAGTLTENSDIRLKENITPLKNVLSSVENITPVYYQFKNKQTHPEGTHIGFIAQEIEKEFPELVNKDSRGYLSVEYSNMTAVLLKSIKELKAEKDKEIDNLKMENRELKERLSNLEKIVNKLSGQELTFTKN